MEMAFCSELACTGRERLGPAVGWPARHRSHAAARRRGNTAAAVGGARVDVGGTERMWRKRPADAVATPQRIRKSQSPLPLLRKLAPKPRGTIYFPITDDPPEPTAADEDEDDGTGDDEDDAEDIAKLLEPLSWEQLVALLRTAAEASPATMAAVHRAAEADPASRKLFVNGLGWGAGAEDLRSAFSRFGELEDCRVISDK
ncbi:unnamed protein product [Miscanthus lutarioriparius]|uniref:RRM domain-containing protein n=1 Tax=Miscanthus lutarioriparius TaxID=422564 RepID=A0A811SQ03_9POAL|nr:unnamed protein product [Miscanthus lutarioriparius]